MNKQHEETNEEEPEEPAKQEEQAKLEMKTRKSKLPPRRETLQQENLQARRAERQRHKNDFCGTNVMISNIESQHQTMRACQYSIKTASKTQRNYCISNTYLCLCHMYSVTRY